MNVQLFLYTLKIYLLSICIFHFPKQNRYKNLKAWRSLIQYYLWGPLWIFFDLRNESGYKNNIFIHLTCFSISRTKYNRWSKRSVTLRTVLLFGVMLNDVPICPTKSSNFRWINKQIWTFIAWFIREIAAS